MSFFAFLKVADSTVGNSIAGGPEESSFRLPFREQCFVLSD